MFLGFFHQHGTQFIFRVGTIGFDNQVGLPGHGITPSGSTPVTVTHGETVQRNPAHKELFQHAIHHVIHPTRFHALVIIHIVTVQIRVGITLLQRIAIYLKLLGQNLFPYHFFEGLTA